MCDQIFQLFHDADALLYRNACAAEQTHYRAFYKNKDLGEVFRYKKDYYAYVKEQREEHQPYFSCEPEVKDLGADIAYSSIDKAILFARKKVGAKRMKFYLTDENKSNFRYDLATILPYKDNRSQEKPKYYHHCMDYIISEWGGEVVIGEEADDAVAQAQMFHLNRLWSGEDASDEDITCIAHIDKDINMVPGWHYHYKTGEVYWVSALEGLRFFYNQILTGDKQVDNIPGLFHMTGVKATAKVKKPLQELETAEEMYAYVLGVYKKYLPEEEMLLDEDGDPYPSPLPPAEVVVNEIGNLLYMRTERGVPWTPPSL